MSWYLEVYKKYAHFGGRARRKEYWMFSLFFSISVMVAGILDSIIGSMGIISALYGLASIVPSISVSVRRLHDIGKSGWFLFVVLIPLIGFIWYLILACTEGNSGENAYGTDPKA